MEKRFMITDFSISFPDYEKVYTAAGTGVTSQQKMLHGTWSYLFLFLKVRVCFAHIFPSDFWLWALFIITTWNRCKFAALSVQKGQVKCTIAPKEVYKSHFFKKCG